MTRISAIGIGMLLVVLACGIGPAAVMAQGQFPVPQPVPPPRYEPGAPRLPIPRLPAQRKEWRGDLARFCSYHCREDLDACLRTRRPIHRYLCYNEFRACSVGWIRARQERQRLCRNIARPR